MESNTDSNDSSMMDCKENRSNNGTPASNSSLKDSNCKDALAPSATDNQEESEDNNDEDSSDDDSMSDDGLSDYERLRLRNIRRNEARLAQLGLLLPNAQNPSQSQQSALTATLSTKKRGRPKGYKKRDKSLEPTRSLPKRRAKIHKRFDPSFQRYKTTRKYTRRSMDPRFKTVGLAVDDHYFTDNEEDYDDDSIPPSPIVLSKIIKPQSHQKDFHDDKKFYLKQRRNRRGRPKREEYVYVCEERCGHCFGGWGEIVEVAGGGKNEYDLVVEHEKKLVPIDVEFLDDDEKKLVRCKDCREAFHPSCMGLNGPAKSEESETTLAAVVVDSELEAIAMEPVDMATDNNTQTLSSSKDYSTEVTRANEKDESNQMQLNNVTVKTTLSQTSNINTSDCDTKESVKNIDTADSTDASAENLTDDKNGSDSQNSRPSDKSDASVQVQLPRRPPRIPKRCSKCEALRKLGIKQDADSKECDKEERDISPPSKKYCSFKLEAVIDGKTLHCSVDPEPSMEANVDGKNIACRVVFGGDSKSKSRSNCRDNDDATSEKPDEVARARKRQKRKTLTSVAKTNDPTARKVEKIVSKASDRIADAIFQEKSLDELQQLVSGPIATESVVRAGGLGMLSNAMTKHPKVPSIQAQSISTMTEIVWYCQSLGVDLVNHACLDLTIAAMETHGTHSEIQQLGCELFRALSYESECCNAMFQADVITFVASSMKRNAIEVNVLKEASLFLQNMIVVTFDTVDILLKTKRGEKSVIFVLVNAIRENQREIEFVSAACDVLCNLSLCKKGISKIIRSNFAAVLQELIKTTEESSEVVQSSMTLLYNMAYSSTALLRELAEADCTSSVIEVLKSSSKDPELYAASFGLLGLLAGIDTVPRSKISNPNMISMVLDAIRDHKNLELELEALSLLSSIEHPADKQLSMKTAKNVLESMETFHNEDEILTSGCKILLGIMRAQPESRALKSLLRSNSGRNTLSSVPNSFRDAVDEVLCDTTKYIVFAGSTLG